ncbi:MAG TPA: zinc ribbon domain-containing protein [Mobilitalea sp.]|nr:zinc ribbon domain-containing protein [Mobilitalea sp.]
MQCRYCGKINDDNVSYCIHCGKMLTESSSLIKEGDYDASYIGFSKPGSAYIGPKVVNIEEDLYESENITDQLSERPLKKPFWIVLYRIIKQHGKLIYKLITIVVVLVMLISLTIQPIESNYAFVSSNALEVTTNQGKNETYVYNTKGKILYTINSAASPIKYTPDCTKVVLRENGGSNFYYISTDEIFKSDYSASFLNISDDGNYFYYTKTDIDSNLSLICHDVKSNKDITIDSLKNTDSSRKFMYGIVKISPDGKTFAYNKASYNISNASSSTTFQNDEEYEAFYSIDNGEVTSLGKGNIVLSISDHGKYVYYAHMYDSQYWDIHVILDKEDYVLAKNCRGHTFNKDGSEVLYMDEDSAYITVDGKTTYTITGGFITNILYPGIFSDNNPAGMNYKVDTFRNKVMVSEDGSIWLIDGSYQARMLDSNAYQYYLSEGGNNLIYRNSEGMIIKVSDLFGVCSKEVLAQQTIDFTASKDFNKIYYTDVNNDLFYKNGDKAPVKIASQVSDMQLNVAGNIIFFITNLRNGIGTLYYSKDGAPAEPVKGGDMTVSLGHNNYGIIFTENANGKLNLYYNTSGTDFKLIAENMQSNVQNNLNNIIYN